MARSQIRQLAKTAFLHALRGFDDETVVRLDHQRALRRSPDLVRPTRFTDKLQHYKLFARDARMPGLVDKIAVKRHVARVLGDAWVTPTLWSGERITETVLRSIDGPAVIKANHASGMIAFFDQHADIAAVAHRANRWRGYDYHLLHREWAYGVVARQLLIETVIAQRAHLTDYKFWVLDGETAFIQVDQGRFARHTRQFYDAVWRQLPITMNYPSDGPALARPAHLQAMLEAARVLADDFPLVRVDLYALDDGPRFGELTFWPEAGLCKFKPESFDAELGARWNYPVASPARARPPGLIPVQVRA
jgi:hypothetical protein